MLMIIETFLLSSKYMYMGSTRPALCHTTITAEYHDQLLVNYFRTCIATGLQVHLSS